ncbi:MAG: Stk1 family PASTA domain-containing Ser/Thr kinase [Oscillospiraceae bacterium]|nr:Stk1 family PASTA domain-containing Ser/Thr kinase [Oscillospiraceae bacterium]
MDQYIGKLLDNRYEILEKVGSGGMAVVYKARCHRLNRLVAIKILKEDLAQDAEFKRRFHDESQAVAMLSHPNIVSVYDVSRSADIDYIVMELIDGITLKQYMQKRGGKLSWQEALHFIIQIMKGLSHAHSRGIIHRDIKPHNIMVLRDGSAKVADFGIARLTSASQTTFTQEALGSVHYISPEQAKGSHIDARSDIYSAGVVLYEMITGRLPYEGDSPVAVAIQHINAIPLSPREINEDIPEALEAITMKAMAADVNRRYISSDAMLEDLEEFRKNPNISFDYSAADLLLDDGDEPTQILGANTPQLARAQARRSDENYRTTGDIPRSRTHAASRDEDYKYERESRRPAIVVGVGIAIFVVAIIIFLVVALGPTLTGSGETIYAPNLTGLTIEQAMERKEVQDNNLTIKAGQTTYSSTYEEGLITAQDPQYNTEITKGSTIIVTISGGADAEKTMLNFVNEDSRMAKMTLEDLGLNLNVELIEENDDSVTSGYVIRQTPVMGTVLHEGDNVTLYVSIGPATETVVVESYLGKTEEEAKALVAEAGLTWGGIEGEEYSDKYEAGLICGQSLAAVTTEVEKGTKISFTLSLGPEPDEEPTPSPSASPSAAPSASVAPSSPAQQGGSSGNGDSGQTSATTSTKTVYVYLPEDRETVSVQIYVGGVAVFSTPRTYDTSLRIVRVDVTGSGQQLIDIYIDGQPQESYTVDFDS